MPARYSRGMKENEMAYRAIFDEKRKFGIELEGFGISRNELADCLEKEKIAVRVSGGYEKLFQKWTVAQDATIAHENSFELISPILTGRWGFQEIRKVCDVVNSLGVQTDASCGFHIHWSVSDFTGRNLINLLWLYGKFEKVLDFIFPPERRDDHSQFAHSLLRQGRMTWLYQLQGAFYVHAYQVAQGFEAGQPTGNKTSYPTARHHKVNVCAYNKYQTVEFRQHEGTFDYEKIKNWLFLSQQLVNRAKNTTVSEGVVTWESLMKTLALTDPQMRESMDSPDKIYLHEMRDFYRKIYRENREKTNV